MHNDGIPVSDVLYGGVSILNTTESGVQLRDSRSLRTDIGD